MDDLEFFKGLNEIKSGQTTSREQATPTVGISAASPATTGNSNNGLQEAWKLLSSPDSWTQASEKDSVLVEQLGVTNYEDLSYLEPEHKSMILGKLKAIPAKKVAINLKFDIKN